MYDHNISHRKCSTARNEAGSKLQSFTNIVVNCVYVPGAFPSSECASDICHSSSTFVPLVTLLKGKQPEAHTDAIVFFNAPLSQL